ncbi:succinylglutamate desuccinylase [Flavobacteriaceae bacterium Ap0902]|nr:succinylglutamate desuccinylase [Flavobacteriaceae bacterium Ap0902]
MPALEIYNTLIPENQKTIIQMNVAHLTTRTPIEIPIFVYKSQHPGPTVLFSAGMHGDEINGVEIVRRILDTDLYKVDRGTVICIPIINIYGFLNFSRYVPDGKDVNRSFPGYAKGSLASKVAYHITKYIIPYIDLGIDFHTGGSQRTNYPQIRGDFSDEMTAQLARDTRAPFLIHSKIILGSLRMAAHENGKKILVYEGGESLRYDKFAIEEGYNCVHRLLKSLDMINRIPEPCSNSILIEDKSWYRCPDSGMWIPAVEYGDYVEKEQSMGFITSPFGDFKSKVVSKEAGYIIGLNNQAVVNKGDALINLGVVAEG